MKISRVLLIFAIIALIFVPSSLSSLGNAKYPRIVASDEVMATAYNSLEAQTDSTPWITASGTRCRWGVVAANHLPIGTKIKIEGFGDKIFIVEDRMNKRYHRKIDIWMPSYKQAMQFGSRKIKYYIIES
ncbi:MAG: 3D domain-containing protein [Candidatus Margulisiibacteriota bacterium]